MQGLISMMNPMDAAGATALVESGLLAGDKDGMYGLRGQPRADWGVPYSMTEVSSAQHATVQRSAAPNKHDLHN